MPCWYKKWPYCRAMSLLKRPILLLLNKVTLPITCNQCMNHPCKGYIHAFLTSGSPSVPSHASTRSKSKNAPQSSLGPIALFVANLRSQALPRQSTIFVGPCRPMLTRDVEGIPKNNINNGNKRPLPICVLGWARRLREDGLRT